MQADVWAAVQCLAMENVNERIVIDKLIIMTQSLDPLVRVTSTKLLVRLSHQSVRIKHGGSCCYGDTRGWYASHRTGR